MSICLVQQHAAQTLRADPFFNGSDGRCPIDFIAEAQHDFYATIQKNLMTRAAVGVVRTPNGTALDFATPDVVAMTETVEVAVMVNLVHNRTGRSQPEIVEGVVRALHGRYSMPEDPASDDYNANAPRFAFASHQLSDIDEDGNAVIVVAFTAPIDILPTTANL